MTDTETLDILDGVAQIARFLNVSKRRGYHLCETGQIPCWKLGNKWAARKSSLIKHFERLEAGEAA